MWFIFPNLTHTWNVKTNMNIQIIIDLSQSKMQVLDEKLLFPFCNPNKSIAKIQYVSMNCADHLRTKNDHRMIISFPQRIFGAKRGNTRQTHWNICVPLICSNVRCVLRMDSGLFRLMQLIKLTEIFLHIISPHPNPFQRNAIQLWCLCPLLVSIDAEDDEISPTEQQHLAFLNSMKANKLHSYECRFS